jgi:putative SOS response-associated peptidase YedK
MCGRYVSPDDAAIEREFNLVRTEWQFPASYNVASTDELPVVRLNKERERTGSRMHWGKMHPLSPSPALRNGWGNLPSRYSFSALRPRIATLRPDAGP